MNSEKKQGRIFNNPILESLTKSNPSTTILFYTSLIVIFFFLNFKYTSNGLYTAIGYYLIGLTTWTLLEYFLHRFIFHIDDYLPFMKRFHYIVHGVHHEDPRDKERLFMPPVPGTIIAITLFSLSYFILGSKAYAFMAGLSNGYLLYSYIHYSVHTKPVYHPLSKLWKNHALHHYKYPDKAFGVSTPFWDFVFRTMPPKNNNK
jgi:sterol desaturase/sphingolipid hydroxylase (fatty acid hydroxylase superfamily)